MNDASRCSASRHAPPMAMFPFEHATNSTVRWNMPGSAGEFRDENVPATPFASPVHRAMFGTSGRLVAGYATIANAEVNKERSSFWRFLATCVARLSVNATHISSSPGLQPENPSTAIWSTILMKTITSYTPVESEQGDIISLIENSLCARSSADAITPRSLLRACAVGAVLSKQLADRPHIYAGPGGRVIVDYALVDGRCTAVVTENYVYVMKDTDGDVRDVTITGDGYNSAALYAITHSH